MAWVVTGWINRKDKTYTGDAAKARRISRTFDDAPSAHRFAQHIVEAGPAHFAEVEKI